MENEIEISEVPAQEQVVEKQPVRVVDDEYVIDPESGSLRRAFPKNQNVASNKAKRRHHGKKK